MTRQQKRAIWISFAIAVLVGGSAAALLFLRHRSYETIAVRRGDIVEAVYGLGTVKTPKQYEVRIGVPASVKQLYVKEGDVVRAQSPLVKFDPALLVTTPISGIVTLVDAHASELVAPQRTIIRVEDLADRYIEVALEQQGILRVEEGQRATVLFESVRGEKFEGTVSAVYSRNQEFLAHIQAKGLRKNVLPGMTADVAIEVSHHENALLVPLSALHGGQVTAVRKGARTKLPVKIGAIDGTWGEILEGELSEGDLVVVRTQKGK